MHIILLQTCVACRGGIPVCFPQFGDLGPVKAQHGFARNTEFTVESATADSATLSLSPTEEQRQGDFPEHTLYVKVYRHKDDSHFTLSSTYA